MSESVSRFPLAGLRVSTTTLVRLVASSVLALLLWGWVTIQQDPLTPVPYPNRPLDVPELGSDLQIVDALDDVTVRVELEGPRSVIREVGVDEVRPRLNLSEVDGPGDYIVPIEVTPPDAVEVREVDPPRLAIVVDQTITESFRVEADTGPPERGPGRVGAVELDTSDVTVGGPRRYVERVSRVVLPIEIGDRTTTFTDRFTPVARDETGQPVTEVEIRPQRIGATVAIEARGRSVPVLVQTAGEPAPAYQVVDREAIPDMVLLDGPDEVVEQILSVSTAPVRIEGATAPVRQAVGLTGLPEGVTVVEPAGGNVDAVVQIAPRATTQTLTALPVEVADLAAGLVAEVVPGTVDVDVYAPEEMLATLRAGDVVPSVSAAGLGPGSYQLPLAVAVPAGVQPLGSEPPQIMVTVRAAPAGTPAPG
ncbi:MAG: CdaR family protein [Chloroflexota bacterium]|nr:CdaR family protein [Chloroflexota bacterium]